MIKSFFFFLSFIPHLVHALIQDIPQSSQLEISVTLYPQDIALIKEKRKIFLKPGFSKLIIRGVPSSVLIDSFLFQSLPPSTPLKVLEYTFQTPHITRDSLLKHSIGNEIHIFSSAPKTASQAGKLLAIDGDNVLVESGGLIFATHKDQIAFPQLPFTLVSEPVITLKVMNLKGEEHLFEMGYLAKGFSWDAGYTIIVDAEEKHLDLNNWINISNRSGMNIKKGHFRITPTQQKSDRFYDIERPISLADKAIKNISWLAAKNLKPIKSFRIFPKNNLIIDEEGIVVKPTVETWLSVQNDTSQGLGIPLPQGIIQVFRRNPDNSLFYIGENKTPLTPIGQFLSLRIGSTKEITAEMRQTDFRKLGSKVVESGYRLDLKNTTSFPKQVTVFQNVSGEWNMLRETHPHEEEENRIKWTLNLGPQEETSLRYRLRMNVE